MSKSARKSGLKSVVLALLLIAIGILFIVKKRDMLQWIMVIAGVVFIAQGVIDVFRHKLTVTGIVQIALGVLAIVFGVWFIKAATVVLGILLILYGLNSLLGDRGNWVAVLVSVLVIVVGILLVVNQWIIADWLVVTLGVMLIIDGVLSLFGKTA